METSDKKPCIPGSKSMNIWYVYPQGSTTLVTLVIKLLQVMTTFHPNDYFDPSNDYFHQILCNIEML